MSYKDIIWLIIMIICIIYLIYSLIKEYINKKVLSKISLFGIINDLAAITLFCIDHYNK